MGAFVVGIDLGTTNTVVAYAARSAADPTANDDGAATAIRLFEIEQLVDRGEVAARRLLPSLRYHPADGELAGGDLTLPWNDPDPAGLTRVAIGALARQLGAQVPGRLVASAKSWLSHAGVDRLAPILPWGAAEEVEKASPVAASASYLAHVRAAWNHRFPDAPLERQDVVLTLPASFDDAARTLTLEAARMAGLSQLQLLEEPQAAFYDWLFRHRDRLAGELSATRLVLVCDTGGGTTDLTLISVEMRDGEPLLTRIAVGDHLMLGGDNMDLALAHVVEARLAGPAGATARLPATRLAQLVDRCRAAKEQLLAADAPDSAPVTLLGAGARVVGAARTVELTREEVERLVVDGFFPLVAATDASQRGRAGIVEFGLPFARDPAITRHLAGFLRQHAQAARAALGLEAPTNDLPVPDTLLLNGGVFRSAKLAGRVAETLAHWRGAELRVLHNDDPDVAVARGAVAYALARDGLAPRIGGGSPRSYFLLLEDGQPKDSQERAPRRAVCLLPQGSQEGHEVRLKDRSFALRVGRPVRFRLLSSVGESAGMPRPRAGDLVDASSDEFVELPPVATVVPPAAAGGRTEVPVHLTTALTELGTLQVHCVAPDDARRWRLEFQLRAAVDEGAARAPAGGALPPRFQEAVEQIDRVFGSRSRAVDPKEVRHLRSELEQRLGARERWPVPLLRSLFDALWQRARGRRRSPDHERLWLNLAGFCLRPGFGHPADDWRIEQLWSIFETGVQHGHDAQVQSEWWTLWRRVAGGLPEAAQLRLLDDFAFNLQGEEAGVKRPPHLVKGAYDDIVRLGAALERIPAPYKVEIGTWLFERIGRTKPARKGTASNDPLTLWAIGRVGARRPFHGSAHAVVASEVAAGWIGKLFELDWKHADSAAFAAAQIARMTGDRSRDIDADLRRQVVARLESAHAAPSWIAMVREVLELDAAAERQVFGEALPPGLKLIA